MRNDYNNLRHVRTLKGVVQLRLKIRRCQNMSCERYRIAYRPEKEGSWILPHHEFGLDVIAYIGALRYQEHRSVPQIHTHLVESKGICVSQRTVTHLIARYDELLSLWLGDRKRLKTIAKEQGRVILAIDGMQPEIGQQLKALLKLPTAIGLEFFIVTKLKIFLELIMT
jgi:hypothetical protein